MRILCIDPSTHCGWAHGFLDGKTRPISGTHSLPTGVKMSRVGLALEAFVIDMVKANAIQRVYFEKPIMPRVTGFDSMAAMLSKPIVISMTCERYGIDAIPIDMATWRSGFGVATAAPRAMPNKTSAEKSARRKWMKKQTIDRCVSLGHDPKDDNEADALGLFYSLIWKHQKRVAQPDLLEGLAI